MQNVISSTKIPGSIVRRHYESVVTGENVFTRFFNWCGLQQENGFMWLAITLFILIGVALPGTLFSIVFLGGNNFSLWILACIINVPSLALNLAAQPTRITLPALFFALIVDAAIILGCAATYILNH